MTAGLIITNPAPYTYQINCIVHSPFLTRSLATAAVLIAQEEEHQPYKQDQPDTCMNEASLNHRLNM
jgi:hypothetical protein